MIVPLLCGLMLLITLMRVAVPVGQQVTGEVLGVVPLGYRERVRLQRVNVYLIGAMLLLGTLGGWMRAPISIMVILAAFVIFSIPVQYTITTAGIARNRSIFREWGEFTGFADERGRILLQGKSRPANLSLLLATDQHAEALRLLEQTPLAAPKRAHSPSPPATTRKHSKNKQRRTATA